MKWVKSMTSFKESVSKLKKGDLLLKKESPHEKGKENVSSGNHLVDKQSSDPHDASKLEDVRKTETKEKEKHSGLEERAVRLCEREGTFVSIRCQSPREGKDNLEQKAEDSQKHKRPSEKRKSDIGDLENTGTVTKRKKLVRFNENPELIPRSNFLDSSATEVPRKPEKSKELEAEPPAKIVASKIDPAASEIPGCSNVDQEKNTQKIDESKANISLKPSLLDNVIESLKLRRRTPGEVIGAVINRLGPNLQKGDRHRPRILSSPQHEVHDELNRNIHVSANGNSSDGFGLASVKIEVVPDVAELLRAGPPVVEHDPFERELENCPCAPETQPLFVEVEVCNFMLLVETFY